MNTALQTLILNHNDIGEAGARALTAALLPKAEGQVKLRVLDVRGNLIAGQAAVELGDAAFGLPTLEEFNGIPVKQLRAVRRCRLTSA